MLAHHQLSIGLLAMLDGIFSWFTLFYCFVGLIYMSYSISIAFAAAVLCLMASIWQFQPVVEQPFALNKQFYNCWYRLNGNLVGIICWCTIMLPMYSAR